MFNVQNGEVSIPVSLFQGLLESINAPRGPHQCFTEGCNEAPAGLAGGRLGEEFVPMHIYCGSCAQRRTDEVLAAHPDCVVESRFMVEDGKGELVESTKDEYYAQLAKKDAPSVIEAAERALDVGYL